MKVDTAAFISFVCRQCRKQKNKNTYTYKRICINHVVWFDENKKKNKQASERASDFLRLLYRFIDWCQTRISAVDSDIKFYDGNAHTIHKSTTTAPQHSWLRISNITLLCLHLVRSVCGDSLLWWWWWWWWWRCRFFLFCVHQTQTDRMVYVVCSHGRIAWIARIRYVVK